MLWINSTPTISGTVQEGQTLTATTGTWTGYPAPTYTYQWQRCDSNGTNCVNIANNAAASNYLLVTADVGSRIRVMVTATNSAGTSGAAPTRSFQPSSAAGPPGTSTRPDRMRM